MNNTHKYTPSRNNNIDSINQLVWTNPIHTSLNPQITRQISYSETLPHMAQSAKTPLGVNPFWESGATPHIVWKKSFLTLKMAIMRQHRSRQTIEIKTTAS